MKDKDRTWRVAEAIRKWGAGTPKCAEDRKVEFKCMCTVPQATVSKLCGLAKSMGPLQCNMEGTEKCPALKTVHEKGKVSRAMRRKGKNVAETMHENIEAKESGEGEMNMLQESKTKREG